MDEDPPVVPRILLDAVVENLDLLLIQKPEDSLLQRTTPLSGDDLDQPNLLVDGFVDDCAQGSVDVITSVVDIVQIKFELDGVGLHPSEVPEACAAPTSR